MQQISAFRLFLIVSLFLNLPFLSLKRLPAQKFPETISVTVGGQVEEKDFEYNEFDFVAEDSTGLYLLRRWSLPQKFGKGSKERYQCSLERYDSSLTRVESKRFALFSEYSRLFAFHNLKDRSWCFFFDRQLYDQIYARNLDKEKMSLSEERKVLVEHRKKFKQNEVTLTNNKFLYDVEKSTGEVVFFWSGVKKVEEKWVYVFYLSVFDKDLHKLWDKFVPTPYEYEKCNIEDIELDRQGRVHVLVRTVSQGTYSHDMAVRGFYGKKTNKNLFWEMLSYLPDGDEKRFAIDTGEDPFLASLYLSETPDGGELIFSGVYKDLKTTESRKFSGLFMGRFDLSGMEFSLKKYIPITIDEALDLYWGTEEIIRKLYETKYNPHGIGFWIVDVFVRDDGGLCLEILTFDQNTSSYSDWTSLVSLSPSGNIEWIRKSVLQYRLGRRNVHISPMSSKYFPTEEPLGFIFNEGALGEKVWERASPALGYFYVSLYDGTLSEVRSLKLDGLDDFYLPVRLGYTVKVSDGDLLLQARGKGKYKDYIRWIRVKYEEEAKYPRL